MSYSPTIAVMIKAAEKAARSLIRDFGEVEKLQVSIKGPNDFFSAADLKAEKIIMEELQKARPSYGFLLEEGGEIEGEDERYRFIVDPLDGTNNFLHSNPNFCTTIALEKTENGKSEIIAGVTLLPATRDIYWAEKGKGAWLIGGENASSLRLRVAARKKIEDSALCVASFRKDIPKMENSADKASAIRCIGSTAIALAYVAAGRFDGFFQAYTQPWDIAAGIILVQEAGGASCDIEGGKRYFETKSIVASNDILINKIL